ncbi:hypothetical protein GCM10023231_01280 [Olivibacter ginsenosidimutans]|uniref:RagB/SusD family nutrient uptake outer membrane protein n=2 Tax=Olivibacter ginsenosidimutans TaxID=1176537 RepID=A0ABP9ABP8_9SPHI
MFSCGKSYLDVKRNQSEVVPHNISDYQALLDKYDLMNLKSCYNLSIVAADEYVVPLDKWETLTHPDQKNAHIWAKEIFEGKSSDDWDEAYNRILIANISADGAEKITPNEMEHEAWSTLKGNAFFYRAFNHYQLTQVFCKPYNAQSADSDLGIVLRTESDVTIRAKRASIAETYAQIINDLETASELLPVKAVIKYRPCRAAAFALLARVYMQMDNYGKALECADSAWELNHTLIDFNELDTELRYSFTIDYESNPEILFISSIPNLQIFSAARYNILPQLYDLYEDDDLRKQIYFYQDPNNGLLFKGSYKGGATFFTGLATDEILLMRAECNVRVGKLSTARECLNLLRAYRYTKEAYSEITEDNRENLLKIALEEKRKELVFRGTRWEDLRRLNKDSRTAVTLERNLDKTVYKIEPNSLRYAFPIPDNEMDLSGLVQNER